MIRDAKPEDFPFLRQVHEATGYDYEFPNLANPLFCVKKVVEEDGRITQGLALEITASIYLWVDPTAGTPASRLRKLRRLVNEAKQAAWEKGLDTVYAVLPPEIEEEFSEVLQFLGMTKDRPWPKWSIVL